MQELTYCPSCGNSTLNWDGEKKWSCRCGFTLYNNVAGAVAVVVRHGDEIFFTRRNQEPKKGKLDLAGGFVDPKESAETTCERELFEELQLDVDKEKLRYLASLPNVYHYKGIDYNTLDLLRIPSENKFEVRLELSEISDTVWIPLTEINPEDIAFDSQRRFFEKYRK